MGHRGNSSPIYAVIYMTNKDAYNISEDSFETLLGMLLPGRSVDTLKVVDAKSQAEVFIFLSHISSIVVRGGDDER